VGKKKKKKKKEERERKIEEAKSVLVVITEKTISNVEICHTASNILHSFAENYVTTNWCAWYIHVDS